MIPFFLFSTRTHNCVGTLSFALSMDKEHTFLNIVPSVCACGKKIMFSKDGDWHIPGAHKRMGKLNSYNTAWEVGYQASPSTEGQTRDVGE